MYMKMSTGIVFSILLLFTRCALIHSEYTNHEDFIRDFKEDPASNLPAFFDFIMEEIMIDMSNNETCGTDWDVLKYQKQMEKISGDIGLYVSKHSIALDSFGKPQEGFFRGNMKYMGNYDECLAIETDLLNFSMQYCQMGVTLTAGGFPLLFSEALCLPSSCGYDGFNDTLIFINSTLAELNVSVTVGMKSFTCTGPDGVKMSAGAVVMIVISCLFLSSSLLATLCDLLVYIYWYFKTRSSNDSGFGVINDDFSHSDKHRFLSESIPLLGDKIKPNRCLNFLWDIVKGFSLYKTVPAVLSTDQPPTAITSINGMRVISMFWVILCHTYVFTYGDQGFANSYDLVSQFLPRFSAQPIINGFFSVDSFFFLSGLLVAYLTFRHMKRSNGRFPFVVYYVHRILRLTPTYMFVLFFYWFLTVHMGNGPNLILNAGPDSPVMEKCRSYWWTNLLYINNFHPNKLTDQCMGWAWYLANDMQFYVISPLLLIPLYHWLPIGVLSVGLVLFSSFGATGFIAGYYGYPANIFFAAQELVPGIPSEDSQIYVKPYCRIAPYLVGIALGYLLYRKFRISVKNVVWSWVIHLSLWLVALMLGIVNVYGLYPSFHGHHMSAAENVSYYMLSRFTWGVTLALVMFLCHNGYGGVVNRFLSLPIWIPLSRLTFNAYLVHEMVMTLVFSEFRNTLYYTDSAIMLYIVSIVVVSYGAAGMVSVFVEYPISNLESAVFKVIGAPLRSSTRRVEDGGNDLKSTSPLEATVRIS